MYISEAQCVCCGACVLICPREGDRPPGQGKAVLDASRCIDVESVSPNGYARAIRSGSEKIVVSHESLVILNSAKERRGDVQ